MDYFKSQSSEKMEHKKLSTSLHILGTLPKETDDQTVRGKSVTSKVRANKDNFIQVAIQHHQLEGQDKPFERKTTK